MSGKSGDFITLYDAAGLSTNVLTAVSLFPDSDAEAAQSQQKETQTLIVLSNDLRYNPHFCSSRAQTVRRAAHGSQHGE